MYPEDRVLVGVINRKRDLLYAQQKHWYRIPVAKMPQGIYTEYLAFFLSGGAVRKQPGGIYYFARKRGVELVRRCDLLPEEQNHRRAQDIYYKVQLSELLSKNPAVLNPSGHAISFIYTTWDRFVKAEHIRDLYSKSDYFVDRIYHALCDSQVHAERYWQAEKQQTGVGASLQISCRDGVVIASTDQLEGSIYLDTDQPAQQTIDEIWTQITIMGGPRLPGESNS